MIILEDEFNDITAIELYEKIFEKIDKDTSLTRLLEM